MHEEEDLDYAHKRHRHYTMLGHLLTYQANNSCLGAVPESCQTPSGQLKDRHGLIEQAPFQGVWNNQLRVFVSFPDQNLVYHSQ